MLKKFAGTLLITNCIVGCIFLTGCIDTKNVTYFHNLPDTVTVALKSLNAPQPVVQVNDQLVIQVGGENEKTVQYINQYFGSGTGGLNASVDIDGNINLPRIGKIHVEGLTQEAARDIITNAYKEYLIDPIVYVKFGNFRYAILGEIKSPGYITATKERVNIFEAIAQSGDLTIYAKRDKVKILRNENGKRSVITVNLLDSSILNSPDFYLHKDDIVYIEPMKSKQNTENFTRIFPIISSVLSLVTLVLVFVNK